MSERSSDQSFDESKIRSTLDKLKNQLQNNFVKAPELTKLISTFRFIIYNQKEIIYNQKKDSNDMDFLNSLIKASLSYGVKHHFSPLMLKVTNVELYQIAKDLICLIVELLFIYPQASFSVFVSELIKAIFTIVQSNDIPLPNIGKIVVNLPAKHGKLQSIQFYMQILLQILKYKVVDNTEIINFIFIFFSTQDDESIQYLSLKCLSKLYPKQIKDGVIQLRVLFYFVFNSLRNVQNIYDKSDYWVGIVIKNAISIFPEKNKFLFFRDFLSYLEKLKPFSKYSFINIIFDMIYSLFEKDHYLCKLSSSMFLSLFKYYYENEKYICLCKKIAEIEEKFGPNIIKSFRKNELMIPALIKITSNKFFQFNPKLYDSMSIQNFYRICAQCDDLPEDVLNHLITSIKNETPEKDLFIPLMKFAKKEIILKLVECDQDTIYEIVKLAKLPRDPDFSTIAKEAIILKALEKKSYKLISYLSKFLSFKKHDKVNSDLIYKKKFEAFFENSVKQLDLYNNHYYINALTKIFDSRVFDIIPKDIISLLLNENKFQAIKNIGKNKLLCGFCLKELLFIMLNKNDFEASAAYLGMKFISFDNLLINAYFNIFDFSKMVFSFIDIEGEEDIVFKKRKKKFSLVLKLFNFIPASMLNQYLIPVLLKENKQNSIIKYFNLLKKKKDSNKQNSIINNLNNSSDLQESNDWFKHPYDVIAPYIYLFFFGYCDQVGRKDGFQNLIPITTKNATMILQDNASKVFPLLFLFLGHPNQNMREQMKPSIGLAFSAIREKDIKRDYTTMFIRAWETYFMHTILFFSQIIRGESNVQKKMVINSLYNSLKYLSSNLHKYYLKLASIMDIAINIKFLRKKCLLFWRDFFKYENQEETLDHLFGHVISQVIPYYNEFSDIVTSILTALIIDNFEKTKKNFPEILNISLFQKLKINKIHTALYSTSTSWNEQIRLINHELESASPQFRKLLLIQLLKILKEHENALNDISADILNCLWRIVSHESNIEVLKLCGRCMGMLPYIQGAQLPEIQLINRDDINEIIISLIKDFLVKLLEDTSEKKNHDTAAYAIQELLKKLEDCKNSNEYLKKFPDDIKKIIEPFATSRFLFSMCKPYTEKEYTAIFNLDSNSTESKTAENEIDSLFSTWLEKWARVLFSISKLESNDNNSNVFYCCETCLSDSSLAVFILPYLIANNTQNSFFIESLRIEWETIFNYLQTNEGKYGWEMAKKAMRLFFQLFDALNKWDIVPGSVHHRGKWITLNIANDKDLAVAAFKTELYTRSLQHLEIYIYEEGENKEMEFLNLIYQELDEPDSKKGFEKQNINKIIIDESMTSKEIQCLNPEQNISNLLDYQYETLQNGRFERALTDSLSLKKTLFHTSLKIDSIISSASLRLLRWSELSNISDHSDEAKYSTPDDEYVINILIGKILYFLKTDKIPDFKMEMKKLYDHLSRLLSSTSMISYGKMIPVLANFRIIEEIHDFCKLNKKISFRFGEWNKQMELSVNIVELITAVRCALIDISQNAKIFLEENQEKNITQSLHDNFASQWLQLAKMCRKSELIFKAEMFCSRAKSFKSLSEECDFEFAKILFAKQNQELAMSFLKNTHIANNEIKSKIIYKTAKWSEKLNSEDSAVIIKMYKESIRLHTESSDGKMQENGKVYFSLAALADKRATSFIQYIEESGDLNIQQRKFKTSKFWNSATAQTLENFFKEQIPLALDNYLKCIKYSPNLSFEAIPRIFFIFFDIGKYFTNRNDSLLPIDLGKGQKEGILNSMKESMKIVDQVHPGVWLNSLSQLISRVEQVQSKTLEEVLFNLIKLSVVNFVQPSMWHLMSIRHSKTSNRSQKYNEIKDYIRKTTNIKIYENIENIDDQLFRLTNRLIQLCTENVTVKGNHGKASTICPKLLSEINYGKPILMPLLSTLTSNFGPESNDIKIKSMEDEIEQILSLRKPKKIMLKSESGRYYHYLCKKDDDLRKDMRMMETASFINRILANDRRCRQRGLSIITYAVICFNETCGMMEWVENTKSFRKTIETMLKYRNISINYGTLKELYISKDKLDEKEMAIRRSNFKKKILPMLPPVLHCWFLNNFKDVSRWFESRLLYTRSTAVWSMIGYVLGLGDRHTENILLNEKTGSCVHVDFNCMFDRSKSLPVPEVVPFRLTQNIVDGMGVLKTDGVFFYTSSLVMETLREKRSRLISVLQTFVHDPLLEWKKGNKTSTEITAKQTLREVERRLAGLSDDRSTLLSTDCVVKNLIEQSTNLNNLTQMFFGWQSFL